jgi:hypothetical protein
MLEVIHLFILSFFQDFMKLKLIGIILSLIVYFRVFFWFI